MDRRGTVESFSASGRDDYGQQTGSWSTVGTYWFSIEGTAGGEDALAEQQHPRTTHKLMTRFNTDIQPAHRITINGTRYDIVSVFDPDGRKRWLEIEAVEHK
jgi:SPP1 family predicted phage head-tail adaptor